MKLSARNVLKGKGVTGAATAHVKLDVGGTVITASDVMIAVG